MSFGLYLSYMTFGFNGELFIFTWVHTNASSFHFFLFFFFISWCSFYYLKTKLKISLNNMFLHHNKFNNRPLVQIVNSPLHFPPLSRRWKPVVDALVPLPLRFNVLILVWFFFQYCNKNMSYNQNTCMQRTCFDYKTYSCSTGTSRNFINNNSMQSILRK